MLPDEFDEVMKYKTFTSPKADREKVKQLYRKVFTEQLSQVTIFARWWWTDSELEEFQRKLGKFPKLCKVELSHLKCDKHSSALASLLRSCNERGIEMSTHFGQPSSEQTCTVS